MLRKEFTNLHLTNGRKPGDGNKVKKEELFGVCGGYYSKKVETGGMARQEGASCGRESTEIALVSAQYSSKKKGNGVLRIELVFNVCKVLLFTLHGRTELFNDSMLR